MLITLLYPTYINMAAKFKTASVDSESTLESPSHSSPQPTSAQPNPTPYQSQKKMRLLTLPRHILNPFHTPARKDGHRKHCYYRDHNQEAEGSDSGMPIGSPPSIRKAPSSPSSSLLKQQGMMDSPGPGFVTSTPEAFARIWASSSLSSSRRRGLASTGTGKRSARESPQSPSIFDSILAEDGDSSVCTSVAEEFTPCAVVQWTRGGLDEMDGGNALVPTAMLDERLVSGLNLLTISPC